MVEKIIANKYLMAGAVVAGLALAYALYKGAGAVADVVGDAAQAVNPLNNDNVINRGFTSIYQGVTGSEGTLGTDVYDIVHSGVVDPTSDNNLIYRGYNKVLQTVTGDDDATIGTKIYEWFH